MNPNSNLWLRRRPGERVLIYDDATLEVWVAVLDVDIDAASAEVEVAGERATLTKDTPVPILQGTGTLTFGGVLDNPEDPAVRIGFYVPRDLRVDREERLKGWRPEDRRTGVVHAGVNGNR